MASKTPKTPNFRCRSVRCRATRVVCTKNRVSDSCMIAPSIMGNAAIDRVSALPQLERILNSEAFAGSERSRTLLRFLVEAAIEGRADSLKEYALGAEALGKGDSFDPRIDPIVRAEASRLRQRLERYYSVEGRSDSLVINLPKGTYAPIFETRRPEHHAEAQRVWPWKVATIALALALSLAL